MKYVLANWKAHKNLQEASEWLQQMKHQTQNSSKLTNLLQTNTLNIILSPPYPFLTLAKETLSSIPGIKIGSQDISSCPSGSYTGEVSAEILTGIVDYSIIGHSERRRNLGETEEMIQKKVSQAQAHSIIPILCITNETNLHYNAEFLLYEPIEAIGSGKNQPIEAVLQMRNKMKLQSTTKFIYGGSANSTNLKEYLTNDLIDGIGVGTASLDFQSFSLVLTQLEQIL